VTRRLGYAEEKVDKMERGWMGIRWHLNTLGKALKRKLPAALGGEAKPARVGGGQTVPKNAALRPETGAKSN